MIPCCIKEARVCKDQFYHIFSSVFRGFTVSYNLGYNITTCVIAVFFQAFRRDLHGCGHVDTYVDGGLLCNYPVSCFDGKYSIEHVR